MADEKVETKVEETKVEETKVDEVEETEEASDETTEESAEHEEETKEDLTVDKQEYALLQLLKDPSTRKQTLLSLAGNAGLKIATGESTKAEVVKSIEELLTESLGGDWSFLAPKLAPALKQAIDQKVSELKQEFDSAEEKRILRESEAAASRMYKKYPDFKNYEKSVSGLMEKIKPEEGLAPYEYLENLYFIAKGRSGQNDLAKKAAQRIKSNLRETETKHGVTEPGNLKSGSKRPSIDEAISLAVSSLREKK